MSANRFTALPAAIGLVASCSVLLSACSSAVMLGSSGAEADGVVTQLRHVSGTSIFYDAAESRELARAASTNGLFELGLDREAREVISGESECLGSLIIDGDRHWFSWSETPDGMHVCR